MKLAAFLCAALLAACGQIPKDPDGTLDRIMAERRFRVGLIATGHPPIGGDRTRLLLQRLAKDSGATPTFETGASERLLARLEEGALDLVIGELAPASPWASNVTLMPPLGEQVSSAGHVHLAVAARNGENAWIAFVQRRVRAVAAQP